MIRRETITASPAAGGAGAATVTVRSTLPITGYICAVHLAYLLSPPAGTTDVTVQGMVAPKVPILTVANAATDGWFFPMHQADNTAGTDITNQGLRIAIEDYIDVTIAQANDDDGVTATIIWDDCS